MSRPQKIHPPIKGAFNNILASVAHGTGAAKQAAQKAERQSRTAPPVKPAPLKKP
jgi:hypothetical protein